MASEKVLQVWFYGVIAVLVIVFIAIAPVACQAPNVARKVLEDNGYTQVQITGYKWFVCGHDDIYSTGFTAVSPNGRHVSGTVCSGLLKSNTIRFD